MKAIDFTVSQSVSLISETFSVNSPNIYFATNESFPNKMASLRIFKTVHQDILFAGFLAEKQTILRGLEKWGSFILKLKSG